MKSITPATPGTVRLMFTWDPTDPVNGKPECIWRIPVISWITEDETVACARDEKRWSAQPVSPFDLAFGWDAPMKHLHKEAFAVDGVIYDADACETFSSEAEWIEACTKWANEEWPKRNRTQEKPE